MRRALAVVLVAWVVLGGAVHADEESDRNRPPLVVVPPFDPPPVPTPPPARLDPPTAAVQLTPGSPTSMPFALDLPARPSPLDVFFLVDTSSSQEESIAGLAKGIHAIAYDLANRGLDVQFGLGELQDLYRVQYRRRVDIGPPGKAFQYHVARMYTQGGEEPDLHALHQVATGSGLPAVGSVGAVAPGQQASWRAGSLRVVVLITDEPFRATDVPPLRDEAVDALNAVDAHVIGIEVSERAGVEEADRLGIVLTSEVRDDLADVAGATGALAPPGGVDCTGNGSYELREGSPLVCTLSEDHDQGVVHLADPLVRMLGGLVDLQPVWLVAGDTKGFSVGLRGDPSNESVDMKKPHVLAFEATFQCGPGLDGASAVVPVVARAGAQELARSTVALQCGALRAVAALRPQAGAALPPPAQPAPVPAPAPAPAPAGAANPMTVTAAQQAHGAQGALAAAPQQQALATQRSDDGPIHDDDGPSPVLPMGGAMAAAAAATAARRSGLARAERRR